MAYDLAELREKARRLREFYMGLTVYGLVNAGLVVIWAVSGGGYFWPIWVMVGWGLGYLIQAISLGMVPALSELFPYFSKDWEEQQIQRWQQGEAQTSFTLAKPELKPDAKSGKSSKEDKTSATS
ncbi:MAG: 2TM domain-containing protein [Holosporales bacterium]